jgi:hypothetical protein
MAVTSADFAAPVPQTAPSGALVAIGAVADPASVKWRTFCATSWNRGVQELR